MADFSIFLGNYVHPITDPLKLRFLLFVIHNQKDLNIDINPIYDLSMVLTYLWFNIYDLK